MDIMNTENETVRLTQYSHGAGCGCKISPQILDRMLAGARSTAHYPQLLVGNETRDDAAVYDTGNGQLIISTTDFFMPIVDDPFDFGRIASANAISDVYAMGGKPIMAIAILGWPVNTLDAAIAGKVLEGSQAICKAAGIPLAGGHSIDCPEPVFGLAVTGLTTRERLKQNSTAKAGDLLYLTKPLGVGILSTAQKKGWIDPQHALIARDSMIRLNDLGAELGSRSYVHGLTDVTGFGLLGHLAEVCEGSGVQARIRFSQVPVIPEALPYLERGAVPGGTNRNWSSYGHKVGPLSETEKNILADPQTSGGLLITVDPANADRFEREMQTLGYTLKPFGKLETRTEGPLITLQES